MRTSSRRLALGISASLLALAAVASRERAARANGFEQPVDVDKPAPAVPGGTLPFAVVDEPVPTGTALAAKDLSRDAVSIATPAFPEGRELKSASGQGRHVFEGAVVRQSRVTAGKVSIPAGGLTYYAEIAPAAPPLSGARISLFGTARTVIDVEQTIVMRKSVTLPFGEPVVLGSSAFTYASWAPMAGTASAGVTAASLAGFEWGRLGLGGFEISMTQPSWHSKTFRDGLIQGRIEEISPQFVRLAWLSATRTDAVTIADRELLADVVKNGQEIPLEGGKKIKVTRVDAGGRVTLETPDGAKTLAAEGDPKRLVEDAEARKKLVFVGSGYAVSVLPGASDFAHGKAFVTVHAKVHVHKRGAELDEDGSFRISPVALPNGHLLGVFVVNDKPIELSADHPTANGPAGAFRLVTTWSGGELDGFGVTNEKGDAKAQVAAKGRTSIDLIAGDGPTIESLRARSGIVSPGAPVAAPPPPAVAPPPEPSAPAPVTEPSWQKDPVGFARPHAAFIGAGAALGFVFAWFLGALRRRTA